MVLTISWSFLRCLESIALTNYRRLFGRFSISFCLYWPCQSSVFAGFLFVCVASLDKIPPWKTWYVWPRDVFKFANEMMMVTVFNILIMADVFFVRNQRFFVNPCFDPFSVGMVCWKRSSVCCWDLWETPQECHQQWQQTGKEKFCDFQTIFFASHCFVQLILDFAHNQTESHRCLQKYWFF